MADKTVDNYITQLENWQAEIVSEVRQIILTAAPEADESIKWAQPVYEINGPFAYIKALRTPSISVSGAGSTSMIRKGICRAAVRKCATSSSPAWTISTSQFLRIMFSKLSN